MAGISDEALPVVPNNYLYNGKELNHEGFSDGTGLDWYDYGFRNYDPQLGRFTEQDPLAGEFATVSPYQYALNDPVANIDEDGLNAFSLLCPGTSGFSIFLMKLGEAVTQIAHSPITRAVSITATSLRLAGIVSNRITVGNEINNSFTERGVGMANNTSGPQDWYLKNKTTQLFWINGSGEKAGYTDLGRTLIFKFVSYIDNTYDGHHPPYNVTGIKLQSTITLSSKEDKNGNLISTSVFSSNPDINGTDNLPILKGRSYFPGLGDNQNKKILFTSGRHFHVEYIQHASVPRIEALGLNFLDYDIPDVAQKLVLSLNGNSLSIQAATDIFPSAKLKVNGIQLFHYEQPSFKATFLRRATSVNFRPYSTSLIETYPRVPTPKFYLRYQN